MATYDLPTGTVGAHGKTLAAGTVDTVNFADDLQFVTVISDGAAPIFYTLDGSTPTVNGGNCFLMPEGAVSADTRDVWQAGATVVKLISAGAATYSVQRGK